MPELSGPPNIEQPSQIPPEINPGELTAVARARFAGAEQQEREGVVDRYASWAAKYPFAATAAETVALFAVKRAIATAGERRGLNLVNGHLAQKETGASKHPVRAAAQTIIAEPVLEELLFRKLVPERAKSGLGIAEKTHSSHIVSLVTTLGFAAAHIGNPTTQEGRDNLAVPLAPLIGGAHYEYLARKRGIKHSVAAHMIHNALFVAAAVPKIKARRADRNR